ncbi:MAG: type II toxin-antitoxin system HigA family antitoxin [Pleurocapsa sp.]
MTLTFDREKYKKLLCIYQPKVIKSEAENETALKVVEQLMHSDSRTPEENELYDLLVTLIEKFEQEYYQPGITSTPQSIFHFLMAQKGIVAEDLMVVFGQEIAAKLLNGQLKIDGDHAKALGDFFNVDSSLFLN